jgi:mannan endo-1,4-beta-mannosidase
VRILGSSELSPLRNSVRPTFRDQSGLYNEALLGGLDFALSEIGKRGMKAVIYLANFWEWSGGFVTYEYWTNGGHYINMNDPAHPWPEFPDLSSQFYGSPKAVALLNHYVRAVVGRTNRITGRRYADDPTIQAWQLANEPRPGVSPDVVKKNMPAYLGWIDGTARLIKSIDPNHMVSTGSEGTQGCAESDQCAFDAHSSPAIDYMTAHIWPQNWSWADPKDLPGTWPTTEKNTRDYFARQVAIAQRLGKPLVVEEFGFPRDDGSFDPASSTTYKDKFYSLIYELALDPAQQGSDRRRSGPARRPGASRRQGRRQGSVGEAARGRGQGAAPFQSRRDFGDDPRHCGAAQLSLKSALARARSLGSQRPAALVRLDRSARRAARRRDVYCEALS